MMPKAPDLSAQRIREALDKAALVSMTDSDGNIIYANDLFLERTGYSREEVLGKNHRIFNSNLHPKEFWQEFWQTIQSGKIFKGVIRDQAKDGSFAWFDSTVIPFLDQKGQPYQYVAIRFEVTDRIETEAKLEQERSKRASLARLAALGELGSGIAHEINNPLSTILARAQLVKRLLAKSGRTEQHTLIRSMDVIEETVRRIETITQGLRAFSREATDLPFEKKKISSIVKDTVKLCQPRFNASGIPLRVFGSEIDIEIECRPVQISQILLNLLNNAYDAVLPLEEKWVEVKIEDSGDDVDIFVTDSGSGIPESIAERIMEPFFSTKEIGKGTGLGLSISKTISESHKGSLQLDRIHPNTQFVLRLPKNQKAKAA